MVLQGAELLFYPTAIGTEPQDPLLDSRLHWQRVMQGHSAANLVPVIASNRIGWESLQHEEGHRQGEVSCRKPNAGLQTSILSLKCLWFRR